MALGFGRQAQIKPEPPGESLTGFGCKSFEVVAYKRPDIAHLRKMPLNLERPTFDGSLSFPEQFLITMDVPSIDVVFRCIIAEQAQIKKIRS